MVITGRLQVTINLPDQEAYRLVADIIDQVQNDLTRQLNTAIEKQKQAPTSYSTTLVSSSQVLADLSAELKRNLTQKIGANSRRTFETCTSGNINPGNYNREQLTTLMNQLQEDLLRQLRDNPGNYNREQLTTLMNQLQEDLLRQLRDGLAQDAYRQSM
ncbi:hypothetical protein QE152_g34211 [Popillia japonica]|uniref:Uncharacterized protein n=1 Tax=Popillia japonica TaxID=7064 RepID=A0AAW1IU51_POPJA